MSVSPAFPGRLLLIFLASLLPAVLAGCAPVRQSAGGGREIRYLQGRRPAGGGTYAGSAACRDCHGEVYASWSATAHARSLLSLEPAGAAGDPSCLRCHATAYGEEGGYSAGEGGDLGAVGCEACHGAAAGHVRDPGNPPSGKIRGDCPPCAASEVCRLCHTPARSPAFSPDLYLPRIRHRRE